MQKFLISIIIIALLAGLGFLAYKFGYPIYQETFAPETKKVYQWTDENGNVHFSDVPVYGEDAEGVSDIQEKQYGDYGKDKLHFEDEGESDRPRKTSRSKSSRASSSSGSSGKRDKDGNFIDRLREQKEEALPKDKRTNNEKVIHTVPMH